MFRQVELNAEHWDLQRILWRFDTNEPIKEYWISRVIYGLASSAVNAVKVLMQAACDYSLEWPKTAEIVKKDFYMDDLLTSVDTEQEAQILKAELIALLRKVGYELAKWRSNCIPLGDEVSEAKSVEEQSSIGVLGIFWDFLNDEFRFKVKDRVQADVITKRIITSEAARLFDSLGLLTPVTIKGKLFIQELWRAGHDWDDALPNDVQIRWKEFYNELKTLSKIRIPRWLGTASDRTVQVHLFADASSKAYGAVAYIRVLENNCWTARILCSRSRVAPVKQVTIPRLELCALEFSCKLIEKIKEINQFKNALLFAWTDSEIVLHWLRKSTTGLKVFVANRVAAILKHIPVENVNHVRSEHNPADIISRGTSAESLLNNKLWWYGPDMLREQIVRWPEWSYKGLNEADEAQLQKECHPIVKNVLLTTIVCGQEEMDLIEKTSSHLVACRITAYVIRFCNACYAPIRNRKGNAKIFVDLENSCTNASRGNIVVKVPQESGKIVILKVPRISIIEMENALSYWTMHSQMKSFPTTYQLVKKEMELPRTDKLWALTPFIDSKGMLRITGRLANTTYTFEKKHPIILSHRSVLAQRLAEQAHREVCHGGAQLCTQYLRRKYGIVNIRVLVRKVIHRCVICCRFRQIASKQLMADLPAVRVQPHPAFYNTGIDYAGPITLKVSRNVKSKGYIAIFVCMAYKAVHLELVSSLESTAFIAALSRFVNLRAGAVHHMYSDNGRNFVGAARMIKEAFDAWEDCKVFEFMQAHSIQWQLNTPLAPHHGGLWEAAVKSTKHHLKRMSGAHEFTFEEYATLLSKIAACLNSRPITPMSRDSNDLSTLSPGHFVTGQPMIVPFEGPLAPVKMNRLSAWQQLDKIQQEFWNRWSQEYIDELQRRNKWANRQTQVKVNDLVFIRNELTPPNLWLMGRIIETHPGRDNRVRTCLVKTQTTELLRPITQLCLLPLRETREENDDNK